MQALNIQEYRVIRDEMAQLKKCVTDYMGFVIGGSGAGVFGLSVISNSDSDLDVAYAALALSVIISFVLLILFYKFNSHNRYAGYCKLLNHERHHTDQSANENSESFDLLTWEICIESLRHSDFDPDYLWELKSSIQITDNGSFVKRLDTELAKYLTRPILVDEEKYRSGLKILRGALAGIGRTRSWGFPPIVVALFFLLSLGFVIYALFAVLNVGISAGSGLLWIATCLAVLGQVYMWVHFVAKLHALMDGSATVDAFYWRFVPIRAKILNVYGIRPEYILL